MVIDQGATVTVVDGGSVDGDIVVAGSLALVGGGHQQHIARGTVNAEVLRANAARDGLRDCAQLPVGFTPRVCGTGSMSVFGHVHVSGLYASVFTPVSIAQGGTVALGASYVDGGFAWGDITNRGTLEFAREGYVYLHGVIHNAPEGVVRFGDFATVKFDAYASYASRAPEQLSV
eukprot:gene41031-6643_t